MTNDQRPASFGVFRTKPAVPAFPTEDPNVLRVPIVETALFNALATIVRNNEIHNWLRDHDPVALKQAKAALLMAEIEEITDEDPTD